MPDFAFAKWRLGFMEPIFFKGMMIPKEEPRDAYIRAIQLIESRHKSLNLASSLREEQDHRGSREVMARK